MAKISLSEAAKRFEVSRPTLQKALKTGVISGERDPAKGWQIDTAELARVYRPRNGEPDKVEPQPEPDISKELQAELERVKAELEAEKAARALIERHLDDLRRLLPAPEDPPVKRRKWWPWGHG